MKRILMVLSAFTLIQAGSPVSAQSRKNIKDSSTVIIFNQSSTNSGEKKSRSGENNIIKIAPLGFVSGTFPILFERSFTDFFSVQFSGGLTSKNYSRSAFTKEGSSIKYTFPWDNDMNDQSEKLHSFDFRKPAMGYMASIQPRVYFESEGLEGSFLGLSFDYYKYNFQIPGMTNTNGDFKQNGAMQNESETLKDFMVHFGNQTLYDRISFEYSTALGIRNVDGSKYVATQTSSTGFREGFATYKQTVFNFNIGLKVGYHF
jgi:hypothetical protein